MDAVQAIDARQLGTVPARMLAIPRQYAPFVDSVLLSHGMILDRCARVAG